MTPSEFPTLCPLKPPLGRDHLGLGPHDLLHFCRDILPWPSILVGKNGAHKQWSYGEIHPEVQKILVDDILSGHDKIHGRPSGGISNRAGMGHQIFMGDIRRQKTERFLLHQPNASFSCSANMGDFTYLPRHFYPKLLKKRGVRCLRVMSPSPSV